MTPADPPSPPYIEFSPFFNPSLIPGIYLYNAFMRLQSFVESLQLNKLETELVINKYMVFHKKCKHE